MFKRRTRLSFRERVSELIYPRSGWRPSDDIFAPKNPAFARHAAPDCVGAFLRGPGLLFSLFRIAHHARHRAGVPVARESSCSTDRDVLRQPDYIPGDCRGELQHRAYAPGNGQRPDARSGQPGMRSTRLLAMSSATCSICSDPSRRHGMASRIWPGQYCSPMASAD